MASDLIFATYVDSAGDFSIAERLVTSIRDFGGKYENSPIKIYASDLIDRDSDSIFCDTEVEVISSPCPEEAAWLFYSGKVYAAGQAERDADNAGSILVWMDADTIIINEPAELDLKEGISLAYCPVMHNRSGSLYDENPDPFWDRIYDVLEIDRAKLFPMISPADRKKIRAYFHCGLLALRPERGLLAGWVEVFEKLYNDPVLVDMCRNDNEKRVFLHQTALTGSVLRKLDREKMIELDGRYNYPAFFERRYGAEVAFDSIEDVVTLRWLIPLSDLGDNWPEELSGSTEKLSWLKENLES